MVVQVAAEDNGVPLLSNQHFIQRSDGSDLLSNVIDIEEASDEFKKTIETEKWVNWFVATILNDCWQLSYCNKHSIY